MTRELVRNEILRPNPRLIDSEAQGIGLSNLCLVNPPGDSDCDIWEALLQGNKCVLLLMTNLGKNVNRPEHSTPTEKEVQNLGPTSGRTLVSLLSVVSCAALIYIG